MAENPNPIDLQKALGGLDYPASKEEVVSTAEKSGADENILQALRSLPDGQFEKPTDVTEAVFGG